MGLRIIFFFFFCYRSYLCFGTKNEQRARVVVRTTLHGLFAQPFLSLAFRTKSKHSLDLDPEIDTVLRPAFSPSLL